MSNYKNRIFSVVAAVWLAFLFVGTTLQQRFSVLAQDVPVESPIVQSAWSSVSDDYYGYSFEIPSNWYKEMGVTPDRWSFYSDPSVVGNDILQPVTSSSGLIKIDFAVEPVANLLPAPDVRNPLVDELGNSNTDALIPYLPEGNWIAIDGVPILLVHQEGETLAEGHAKFFTEATSAYILGERLVYYFWIAYAPPNGKDESANSDFAKIQDHILQSLIINPQPLAAWRPTK